MMDARLPELADQLLLIERALRLLELWAETPPAADALASTQPFALDALRFEEWLQWIFLPRMKHIIEHNQALPNASGIRAMAEVVYADHPNPHALLEALGCFDRLIQSRARP